MISLNPINENCERREHVRINHTSILKIEDLESGKIHDAKMVNYSKAGLCFETDSVLQPGNEICIEIQDSPFALKSGELEYYNAEIVWQKELEDTFFNLSYGAKFIPSSDKRKSESNTSIERENEDIIRTKSYRKIIRFSDRSKNYKGFIQDISASGVFLTSQDTFEIGQVLSFVLPLKNGTEEKTEGQIVWTDDKGIGVIFLNEI